MKIQTRKTELFERLNITHGSANEIHDRKKIQSNQWVLPGPTSPN
jgi:hypothetical protein